MSLLVHFTPPLPDRTCRFVVEVCRAAGKVVDVRHDLPVKVVPGQTVQVIDGEGQLTGSGFGIFLTAEWAGVVEPSIHVAGLPLSRESAYEFRLYLITTICHELAHYEQFRDRRKVQERGVVVRTKTLVKLVGEQLRARGVRI